MMACFSVLSFDDNDPVDFVQITGYTIKPEYTVYSIRVCIGHIEWTVDRRYSEFNQFERGRSKGRESGQLSLPSKRLLRNQDVEFLNKRRKELELYLKTVFKEECLSQKALGLSSVPRQLARFLDFHLYEVHAIVDDFAQRCINDECCHRFVEMTALEAFAISERFKFAEPSLGCSTDHQFDLGHVAEFIHRVVELKISCSNKTGSSNICQRKLPFDLHYFKSLLVFSITDCDPAQIMHLDALRPQLQSLTAQNTLSHISDLVCPDEGEHIPEELPPWCHLQFVNLSFNNLCRIDRSIMAFRFISYLDLTCNCLKDISCLQHLPYLRELNLSNNQIEKIENWHCKLGNVKIIRLTNNKVQSLKGLSKLYSLEFLDVRYNQLRQMRHVWPIGQLPCLRDLKLTGNTVENSLDWRTRMLEAFGERASEVTLDGSEPTQRELDTVNVRLAIRKAKEDRRRQLAALAEQLHQQVGLAEAELLRVATSGSSLQRSAESHSPYS